MILVGQILGHGVVSLLVWKSRTEEIALPGGSCEIPKNSLTTGISSKGPLDYRKSKLSIVPN